MAIQFVVVNFHEDRDVMVDGQHNGQTNESINVGEGSHEFKLGGARNYTPASFVKQVTDTSSLNPLIVQFLPAE